MKTITHEGIEYIQKDHVDEIVRQRISKYSEKLTATEAKLSEYESQLDEARVKMKLVDTLTSQVETLQSDLSTAKSQYERHTIISQYGITDGDVREAVEWTYNKKMSTLPKKDQVSLGDWLQTIKDDPSSAPSILRPFFTDSTQSESAPVQSTPQNPSTPSSHTPPPSNRGVSVQSSNIPPSDILQRANDPSFYAQNREAIREAYYKQSNNTSPYKF